MERITGDQVKAAMIAANITRADRQNCQCGTPMFYSRVGDQLYYNSDHPAHDSPHAFSWQDAADWINATKDSTAKSEVAAKFGLTL